MSYQKQKFIDYMFKKGNVQPGGYCNGLDNVEKLFSVDIDEEYSKDECVSLYNRIQEMRNHPEQIGKNEHTVRQYASNVRKYTEFRQEQGGGSVKFTWIPFYEEFATKLLAYKNKREELLELIKLCYEDLPFEYPFREQGREDYDDIDPFTIFGTFNKSIKDENRIIILKKYKEVFSVEAEVPKDFVGIPFLMNVSAWFFAYKANRAEHDIDNLWHLFEVALALADGDTSQEKEFIDIYNQVITQRQVKWNITIGLYWVRPKVFLSLDSVSRAFLPEFNPPVGLSISGSLKDVPNGEEYLCDINALKKSFVNGTPSVQTFYELSHKAFGFAENKEQTQTKIDKNVRYWLYSPGERAFNWERDIETGTMALGWDFLGDFTQYNDETLLAKFQERYNDTSSHKNDKCAILDFVNKMKIGDVIFAKRGTDKIIGRGIVQSDYYYDEIYDKYKSLRKVQWTDIGEWEHPGKAVVKTLTDITIYDGYPEELIARIEGKCVESVVKESIESYIKSDFLNEVYIPEEKYETCVSRLKHKKNIILQGAPGVGKTFAARRLAWSIMGVKDDNRIEFVQFHQSYSYEDFIMGYKPAGDGFALENGLFYNFCLKAKNDPDNEYFFIIDEINRGNMSKIFGELLMLIENDYRDMEITLAYDKRPFSVPKNLYIIGMMNTADRSLAMIDYALRRRFSFVEMTPGFDSEGFVSYQSDINNDKFNKLISRVKALNADIENDASLGKGFCIGHSYFCGLKEDCTDAVLKEIVDYDIVPMLEEYWFDDEAKAKNWSNDLSGVFNG